VEILKTDRYTSSSGKSVDISEKVTTSVEESRYYTPTELKKIEEKILSQKHIYPLTRIEVKNETTLSGAARMASDFTRIGVLNFAAAKTPGGGFKKGACAQEESLAHSSALYSSLLAFPDFYSFHRQKYASLLYSDRIIYSPGCRVFRRDDGSLLDKPYLVNFITCSAPNNGAPMKYRLEEANKIRRVLRSRAKIILSTTVFHKCDDLILGAWGCGVFGNNPDTVAWIFAEYLTDGGPFAGMYTKVLFSVLDTSRNKNIITSFKNKLEKG
jgi:uncharacterized protein (TIGR02452 family)